MRALSSYFGMKFENINKFRSKNWKILIDRLLFRKKRRAFEMQFHFLVVSFLLKKETFMRRSCGLL